MNILFIHQNMPGQFKYLATELAKKHRVVFISCDNGVTLPSIQKKIIRHHKPAKQSDMHQYLQSIEPMIYNGQACFRACKELKDDGYIPDVIYGHPGWGDMLFVKDIFPNTPIINYCEFYYRGTGADVHFNSSTINYNTLARTRIKNTHLLSSLESCDYGIAPTKWQQSLHPKEFHEKIMVCHEGIQTSFVTANDSASLTINSSLTLDRTTPIITYVARNLEPDRGFPTAMKAIHNVMKTNSSVHAIIVGGDDVSYGRPSSSGKSYREDVLEELDLPLDRIHFLGKVPYDTYLTVLQISTVHLYLTIPFVLSWSLLEAMSAECLIVASDTAPVQEVITHNKNGFLVDIHSVEDIAQSLHHALDQSNDHRHIKQAARETIINNYNLTECLKQQIHLIESCSFTKETIYIS